MKRTHKQMWRSIIALVLTFTLVFGTASTAFATSKPSSADIDAQIKAELDAAYDSLTAEEKAQLEELKVKAEDVAAAAKEYVETEQYKVDYAEKVFPYVEEYSDEALFGLAEAKNALDVAADAVADFNFDQLDAGIDNVDKLDPAEMEAAALEAIANAKETIAAIEDILKGELEGDFDKDLATLATLLDELEQNLNDVYAALEIVAPYLVAELELAYNEYIVPAVNAFIDAVEAAVEAAIAELKAAAEKAYAEFIDWLFAEFFPGVDKALYDWFYNNPETVIAFFTEYGDEIGAFFVKFHEEIACVLGYVAVEFGADALKYALENPCDALAAWVKWYEKYGDRVWPMIAVYLEALGITPETVKDYINENLDELYDLLLEYADEMADFIYAYAEEVIDALEAKLAELDEAARTALEELKAAIYEDVEAVVEALIALQEEIEAMYEAATSGSYTVTDDSYYVAMGDTAAEYAEIVAEEMKLNADQFVNAGIPGITAEELAALLAAGDEELVAEIEKADFITVGFSNNTITAYAKEQVADLMAKGAEEMDWAAVVGPNGAAAIEEALVDIEATLVAEGLGEAAEMVVTAVEAYAYACISFASNYPEVIDTIKAINPEAQVVIVGMYNPFENAVLAVEGVEVPVGEFVGALVDLANIHYVAYAMVTGNAVYVDAPAVETKAPFTAAMGIEEFVATLADLDVMEPSEAGNAYIAEQILKIMNVVDKDAYNFQKLIDEIKDFGDVNRDNLEDAKALAEAAREAWDALTDEEKALVGLDAYKVLVEFELEIAKVELAIAEDIAAAEKALAEAEAELAAIERALQITESTVANLKAKVINKSQIKVTWEAADVTPDQYRVTLLRAGERVGTYWVAGDKESVVLKNILRGTNFTVRVTPVAKYDGKKYFSIYKTTNKVVTKLQKANLTVKKANNARVIKSADMNSTGYQIWISKDKNFKKGVTKFVYKTNKAGLNATIKNKNFKKGANYVKVRAYTKVNGKTVYGAWSGTVKVVK